MPSTKARLDRLERRYQGTGETLAEVFDRLLPGAGEPDRTILLDMPEASAERLQELMDKLSDQGLERLHGELTQAVFRRA